MGQGLGDAIAEALKIVGITPERVEAWLGRPCGCLRRQRKLNRLGRWARQTLAGEFSNPKRDAGWVLRRILGIGRNE